MTSAVKVWGATSGTRAERTISGTVPAAGRRRGKNLRVIVSWNQSAGAVDASGVGLAWSSDWIDGRETDLAPLFAFVMGTLPGFAFCDWLEERGLIPPADVLELLRAV
jgi:hypothetical protein